MREIITKSGENIITEIYVLVVWGSITSFLGHSSLQTFHLLYVLMRCYIIAET